MSADVFDTRAVRERVLGTWRTDPARLREDANTEEDHARGYYRDRVVVELAQNAADAAARSGRPGRLLLRLTGRRLVAANTGAPLDAAGVASMAAMRVSTSRDDASGAALVGRFGVGFAGVRAVADRVTVASADGAVEFSADRTRAAVAALGPEQAAELERREGAVPALRLPFPAEDRPEPGYDTTVVLDLRDDQAAEAVAAMLAEVGDPLLLALPALTEIVVEDERHGRLRRIAGLDERWYRTTATGELPPEAMAGRPVEERGRRGWRITWAVPRAALVDDPVAALFGEAEPGPSWPRVVHAPTPTDDVLDLPALLVATLPLDPTRRHVAPGAATDALLALAAELYARWAAELADAGEDPLLLAPTGLAGSELDRQLRELLIDRLAHTPLLLSAGPDPEPIAPVRVVGLTGDGAPALAAALSPWFQALVALPPGRTAAARLLGVELRDAADLIEELPTAEQDPGRWHELYAALAGAVTDPRTRELLAALPVPLADGRVVRGARGLLLPGPGVDTGRLDGLGLRLVDPRAAHPVLERLGALPAGPEVLLDHPAVRQAVLDSAEEDADTAERVSEAVLGLLRAAGADGRDGRPVPVDRAVLGVLTLRDADGEPAPAHGLLLPGSPAAELLDPRVLGEVDGDQLGRWGAGVLTAAGVRAGLVVLRAEDRVTGDGPEDEVDDLLAEQLDGWAEYREALAGSLGTGAVLEPLLAVADLDAVHPDRWAAALAALARPGATRDALLDPVRAADGPGSAPSYTLWWLRERSGLGLDRPFAGPGADPALRRLLPAAPALLAGLDPAVLRALGAVDRADQVPAADWERVLRGVARVGETLPVSWAAAVWSALAAADDAVPVELLPALVSADRVVLVHAEDAAVAPAPMWWQRTDLAAQLPVTGGGDPERIATVLDLPLSSELADGLVDDPDDGALSVTPEAVRDLLPGAPTSWIEHEDLRVDGVPVDWWVEGTGPGATVHATHLAGLARGLAQAAGRWELRTTAELLLTEPGRADELAVERVAE